MAKQYTVPRSNEVRFMPDTREQVAQTTRICTSKLCNAFRDRIAMLKRKS